MFMKTKTDSRIAFSLEFLSLHEKNNPPSTPPPKHMQTLLFSSVIDCLNLTHLSTTSRIEIVKVVVIFHHRHVKWLHSSHLLSYSNILKVCSHTMSVAADIGDKSITTVCIYVTDFQHFSKVPTMHDKGPTKGGPEVTGFFPRPAPFQATCSLGLFL